MQLLKLISKLPWRLLYWFSNCLYILVYFVVGYRKKVVFENLTNAFPEKTALEIRIIAKQFYQNLCDIFLETLKGLSMSENEFRERVKIRNPLEYESHLANKKVVLAMVGHTCCWEWISLRSALECQVDVIYKPLSNQSFDKLIFSIRSRFGILPIPMKQTIREMIKRKQIPRLIGIVADQTPELVETAYWTDFLHQKTDFFTGTEKMAKQFDYPVLYCELIRVKRGYYEMNFIPLNPDSDSNLSITEMYVRTLEKSIRQNPADWLWSHRRWKHEYRMINV